MNKSNSGNPKKGGGIRAAVFFGALWAAAIGVLWWSLKLPDESLAGGLLNWVARFHVLLLHIPVALIFLIIAMEFFSRIEGVGNLREAIVFALWINFFGSAGASILGYLLMGVEEAAGKAMTFHMWTGLGVVVLVLFALVFKLKNAAVPYFASLFASALCVAAAGHYGGAMVHEADYLSEFGPESLKPILLGGLADPKKHEEKGPGESNGENPAEEGDDDAGTPLVQRSVYAHFVVPILDQSCNECHNENKIKGKLRMDTHELLLKGAEGSDFPTVVPGNAEESELLVRVLLPSDDDDFMPPKGEGLAKEEIDVLKWWIQAGAKQETTVAELGDDPAILAALLAVEEKLAAEDELEDVWEPVWDTLSPEEKEERMNAVLLEAQRLSITVMPVSDQDPRLRVNALNGAADFGDQDLESLAPVAEQIVWLNLGKSQVSDDGMKVINGMRNLEKLHLEHTAVTDKGIGYLRALKKLSYLNLYGTDVSDAIFDSFREMPGLRRVYVWGTKVDPATARSYEQSVNLQVNTGMDLEAAAAEAQAKEEAAKKKAADAAARKNREAEAAKAPKPKAPPKGTGPAKGKAAPKAKK